MNITVKQLISKLSKLPDNAIVSTGVISKEPAHLFINTLNPKKVNCHLIITDDLGLIEAPIKGLQISHNNFNNVYMATYDNVTEYSASEAKALVALMSNFENEAN